MESLFKSIASGVLLGVVIFIFLNIFSEYISEENEVLFMAGIAGVAFPLIDFITKKLKSKSRMDS